jgi:hypothetical protein|tara:strand:- start:7882 stop:8160 length:279 start_codon:yes stop_codon:yes gene_type:complete
VFEIIKPCSNCNSFVLKPKKNLKLDLEKTIKTFEEKKFIVNVYTGSLLSIFKKCKINIYSSGKIIVITKDQELLENIKNELSSILYPYIQSD